MVNLSNLPKTTERDKKRVGRGKRGARGAKSGRGTKGALKRGKMRLYFEGGALPLTKRIPMLRGKGKNKPKSAKPIVVNICDLGKLRAGSVVDIERLIKEGLIDKRQVKGRGVKILGRGKIDKKIKVKNIPVSQGAEKKIREAGGEVLFTT